MTCPEFSCSVLIERSRTQVNWYVPGPFPRKPAGLWESNQSLQKRISLPHPTNTRL